VQPLFDLGKASTTMSVDSGDQHAGLTTTLETRMGSDSGLVRAYPQARFNSSVIRLTCASQWSLGHEASVGTPPPGVLWQTRRASEEIRIAED